MSVLKNIKYFASLVGVIVTVELGDFSADESLKPIDLNNIVDGYYKLDMLGYGLGARTFFGKQYYFPVLDVDRMEKAVNFTKTYKSLTNLS